MAQFGRALRSGRRGRKFKSCHPDHVAASYISLAATFLQKSPTRSFRCVSFSKTGHVRFGCSLVNALTTPLVHYQCRPASSAVVITAIWSIWPMWWKSGKSSYPCGEAFVSPSAEPTTKPYKVLLSGISISKSIKDKEKGRTWQF